MAVTSLWTFREQTNR